MTKKLRFNAPPHHTLRPNGPDSEPVAGGEEFTCSDKQALELLTSPHMDVSEVKGQGKPKGKPKGTEEKPEAGDGEGQKANNEEA